MSRRADAISCREIQEEVYLIKKICGLENVLYFPIVKFAENVLPELFNDDYSFLVGTKEEMGEKHGETFPDLHTIRIREDVYLRAIKGSGRDRLTIAHEIGHLFLHGGKSVSFCRLGTGQTILPYEDPEWQANCFGGELLASAYLIENMLIEEVVDKCGVSYDAAKIQLGRTKNRL